ncbi:MAG: leucine-rich repeat domain-containing protein [Defluviitaleaceae bacterium]|nr:leucine-rich repeat domain-containing protein [Defluviitaleaceae bacterium]
MCAKKYLIGVVAVAALVVGFLWGVSVGGRQGQDIAAVAATDGGAGEAVPTIPEYINIRGQQYSTDLTKLVLPLDLTDEEIQPLQYMVNLRVLDLHSNQITDITPLANLTGLVDLTLADNQLSDISALASLTNLVRLDLSGNQLSDIAPLSNLPQLTRLYIIGNQISDVSPLADLSELYELQLDSPPVSDWTPIQNVPLVSGGA